MAVRFREAKADMEEMTIWEQYTITLNKDPKVGFGLAISGGRDKPNPDTADTAVVISDIVRNGPAAGRLHTRDHIVMVNGVSMENVTSSFTIQHLKSCGKTANITVKRPRRIQIPATSRPTRSASQSDLLDGPRTQRGPRYGSDSGSEPAYGQKGRRARSQTPDRNGHALPLMSGFKRLPTQEGPEKPIKATLLKKKPVDEYGLKLGSQIFIKHMTDTGLAAKEGTLQEGDLVLKINGMTTENLSLLETKHLVEKSKGKLTMLVLRDNRRFLVNIPEVEDSAPNSEEDNHESSSSELEDISDLDSEMPPVNKGRAPRSDARERRTRRTRAEAAVPAKSRDSPPLRSTLTRPPAQAMPPRRMPSDSDSDRSASPSPRRDSPNTKYRTLSGIPVSNPQSAPKAYSMDSSQWPPPRASSTASRPRREVSESDSDRSASPPPGRNSPKVDNQTRYRVLPDLAHPGVSLRPTSNRRGPSLARPPPEDDSESDSSSGPPRRQSTPSDQDVQSRYRAVPEVSRPPPSVEPPRWTVPPARQISETKKQSGSESEDSYASPPKVDPLETRSTKHSRNGYRVFPEMPSSSVLLRQTPPQRGSSLGRHTPADSSGSDRAPSPPRRYESTDHESSFSVPLNGTLRSDESMPRNPLLYSKSQEEPLYSLPPDSTDAINPGYSSNLKKVEFVKDSSVGLRLVGGNDVGIFVGGVQPNSPAYVQGMKEGDQIMQVNGVDFNHFTREEAAVFLLNMHKGEHVEIYSQNKMDIYRKILKSNLGDSFYVRTHFDHEPESNTGLGFSRGDVFRVLDTMHRGKLGNWLAIRMGNDLHELGKGTIPNQTRAETMANIEQSQRGGGERSVSGPRAEFWKLRGLRGAKKNTRKTRDDLLQLTVQGKYPAYEKVVLREASFKRPIVILGPLNDVAMEKLAREMPEEFEIAEMVPRNGGEGSSSVIKLETVRQIAEQNKHPLVDITPTAVERLKYIQYHPIVLFLDPHSRKDVKIMRQKFCPDSNKSSRRLYGQACKTRKHYSHLFAERIALHPSSNVWYEVLNEKIRQQQAKPVWVSEVMLEGSGEEEFDILSRSRSSDYLSCDSRATSDYEDTDGEVYTDGEAYTDEDLEDPYYDQDNSVNPISTRRALARSSEPASGQESPAPDFTPDLDPESEFPMHQSPERELPPILHVPKPKPSHYVPKSPTQASDVASSHGVSEFPYDFSGTEHATSNSPSDVPPDFRAPDPLNQDSFPDPPVTEDLSESHQPASLSAIEEKLQQTRMAEPQRKKNTPQFIVLAHHQALQCRRTQIRGSDSSDDNDDNDDIEWGPATEL